ncbi:MAG: hypothetical protein WCL07_01370 [bacterium]
MLVLRSIRQRFHIVNLALIVALALSLSVVFNFTHAKDTIPSQSLEISPPSQEANADPGATITIKAKVRNSGGQPTNIKVRLEDFTASGAEGQVALINNGDQSLSSYTKLSRDNFSLQPGESQEITATIKLPKNTAGGKYGAFVFSSLGGATDPGSAAVSQEVASLFLIKVSGDVVEDLQLGGFFVPSFLEFGPVPFLLQFNNMGNVHLKPYGLVNVRDVFGNSVKDIVVKGETNVFPKASRQMHITLDNKFLCGPYTAHALINYGSKNQTLSLTTRFFVFPIRIALIALLLVFVIYRGRKRIAKAIKALGGK